MNRDIAGVYLLKSHVRATQYTTKKGTLISRSEHENKVLAKYVIPSDRSIKHISEEKTPWGVHFHMFDGVGKQEPSQIAGAVFLCCSYLCPT